MNPGDKCRLGGSAFAQCFKQLGNDSPDLENAEYFTKCFELLQEWINNRQLLSGHDVSDGGLITAVLEMAFAGNRSIDLNLESRHALIPTLFAEELGVVLEADESLLTTLLRDAESTGVELRTLGKASPQFGQDAKVTCALSYIG